MTEPVIQASPNPLLQVRLGDDLSRHGAIWAVVRRREPC